MSNKLKIDALQIKLEFSGSKEDIRRGYDMTRELLIMHFHEQLVRAEQKKQDEEAQSHPRASKTSQKATQSQWAPPTEQAEVLHVSIALCSDFYNKVCVLEREDYAQSMFNNVINFDHIQRIYIRSSQKETFQQHFDIGKVLWRELTTEGRSAVRSE